MSKLDINDGPSKSEIESANKSSVFEFVVSNRTAKLLVKLGNIVKKDEVGNSLVMDFQTDSIHGGEFSGTIEYSTESRTGKAIVHDYEWMYSEAKKNNEAMGGCWQLNDREIVEVVDGSGVKYFEPVKTGHTVECVRCQRKFFGAPARCERCRGTNFRATTS